MELFARKIENLTDARYFAAWNIDYLSFEIPHADGSSSISMADITEIKIGCPAPHILVNMQWALVGKRLNISMNS